MTELLAFHLPQFHTFPENDLWWGKGFTEWTNVKRAQPNFSEHYQPRVPFNNYYYDLSNPDSLKWQMELAQKYGVYGFCYYHYWFNGKLLMQKPLEMMLELKEKIPFCFCWANEPWTRAWDGRSKDVLIGQDYGNEQDWEDHFLYLLPFFQDDAYIKIDGKPVFVLYRTNNIPKVDDMLSYWNERCISSGFPGIYLIEEKNGFNKEVFSTESSGLLDFEPMNALSNSRTFFQKAKDKTRNTYNHLALKLECGIYDYDYVWNIILDHSKDTIEGVDRFLGAFVDWDNTPRRQSKSMIVNGATPEKFGYYLAQQKENADAINSPFIFLNAWNEWGEGAYLEPDTKWGYQYLEQVKRVFS